MRTLLEIARQAQRDSLDALERELALPQQAIQSPSRPELSVHVAVYGVPDGDEARIRQAIDKTIRLAIDEVYGETD